MNIVFDFKIFLQQKMVDHLYFFNLFEYINKRNEKTRYIVSPVYYNEFLNFSKYRNKIIGTKIPKIKFTGRINNKSTENLQIIL